MGVEFRLHRFEFFSKFSILILHLGEVGLDFFDGVALLKDDVLQRCDKVRGCWLVAAPRTFNVIQFQPKPNQFRLRR